jgi:hypothetical protein
MAASYDNYILPLLPEPLQSLSSSISPFITSVLIAVSNGDIVSLAAFVLTIYLSIKIADYIRRSVIGWVVFFVKIAVVIGVLQAAFYVNRVGVQKAIGDAEWAVGLLWGLVEEKVIGWSEGRENGTRGYPGGFGNAAYGGRQQVPVKRSRSRPKGRSGYGWT